MARWLQLSIGFAATAGFVWLLAREVDLDALGRAFAGLPAARTRRRPSRSGPRGASAPPAFEKPHPELPRRQRSGRES